MGASPGPHAAPPAASRANLSDKQTGWAARGAEGGHPCLMDEEHPERAARTERGEEARGPPRDVHWGAVAGALLLGLRALLRTRRRGMSEGR